MKVNIGKFPKKFDAQRKISVQIDDFDTWSLDHTLALIIHPALVKFKQDSLETGHPCLGSDDVESCTSGICGCETKWQEMLDKMIYAFKSIIDDEFSETAEEKKIQEGLELFGKYYRGLWT